MSGPLTVVIADDHPLFRQGLADVLRGDSAVQVVGEAGDGETAMAQIERLRPRVAVLDVAMPKLDGLEVARRVQESGLPVGLILLTMHDEPEILERAIACGVSGYVLKDSAAADLLACIHYVAEGRVYISPGLSRHLVRRGGGGASFPPRAGERLDHLTPVERRVLGLIAKRNTTGQIAAELGIRPKTVDNHRANICKKLGVTGSNALVWYAMEYRHLLG